MHLTAILFLTLRFCNVYVSELLIHCIRLEEESTNLFFTFTIISIAELIVFTWTKHLGCLFGSRLRFMLTGVIYKKIHSLSLNQIDLFSKGKIINIAA